MSKGSPVGFTVAVLILVALRKGPQEVPEIAKVVGLNEKKVVMWLEAFRWAEIIKSNLSMNNGRYRILWELNATQEDRNKRKEAPIRIDAHKVAIAEFLGVALASPKTMEDIDLHLGISSGIVYLYFNVLVEHRVVRVELRERTGRPGPKRRVYISQLLVPDAELVDSRNMLKTNTPTKKGFVNKGVVTEGPRRGSTPIQRWVKDWKRGDTPTRPMSIFSLGE